MDLHTILKQGITFGPFKTAHHQSIVNAEFQAAFLRRLAEAIVPNLSIGTDSVKGTVSARYDEEKYFGPNSVVKFRYSFRGTFYQGNRQERVDFGFEVEPLPSGFRLVFGEPTLTSARDFERHEEGERAALRRLDREADQVLLPDKSITDHWQSCALVWIECKTLLGDMLGPVGTRPLEHHLCERFAQLHPGSESFLLEKLMDPDPLLAAYAFKCWIRVAEPARHRIPPAVFSRTEPIQTHFGCFVSTVPLGEWIADFWKGKEA
jgi:hypothetical protein